MPLPINRVPPGLVSLLDVKNYGMNPVQLADQLSPTLDLGNAYAAANAQVVYGATAGLAAVGTFAPTAAGDNFRVPAGQLWIVEKIAITPQAALGAGNTLTFAVCVYEITNGFVLYAGRPVSGAVGDRPIGSTDRQLIVPAGQAIGLIIESIAGPAITFDFNGSVTRLSV